MAPRREKRPRVEDVYEEIEQNFDEVTQFRIPEFIERFRREFSHRLVLIEWGINAMEVTHSIVTNLTNCGWTWMFTDLVILNDSMEKEFYVQIQINEPDPHIDHFVAYIGDFEFTFF